MGQSFDDCYPFKSHYLDLDGKRYHYVDEGSGPVLLMVHGNPTWSFYYRNLIKHFSKTHRVIAPDHMGCGYSDKPQDPDYYQYQQHVDNLKALYEHLDLDSFSMVVHDWGGPTGLGLAVAHPDKLEKLVVFNSSCTTKTNYPFRIKICSWPLLGPLLIRGFNGFAKGAVYMGVCKKLAPEVAAGLLKPYDSWANRIANLRFVQNIPFSKHSATYKNGAAVISKLDTIKDTPTRIFWGDKDFCFTESFLKDWEKQFPDHETTRFQNGGHYIVEDEIDAIIPEMETFLNADS